MTRLTLTISVNDAYLWDARTRGNVFVDIIVDTTMEDTFAGTGDNGDNRETFTKFENNKSVLHYEPYEGTKLYVDLVKKRVGGEDEHQKYDFVVGELVTCERKYEGKLPLNEWIIHFKEPYASRFKNKELSIIYTIKEQSRYSYEPIDDTSMADLVDRQIVKTYKIEQEG